MMDRFNIKIASLRTPLPSKQNRWSRLISVLLLTILLLPSCRVRKEPDKVWDLRGKMVTLAKSLKGLPYRYGGEELDGFDCSGFVFYVYDCFGVKIPRTAKQQAKMKRRIKFKYAKPADILIFKFRRRYHTAIYTGKNSFIHAPNKKERVRQEQINKYWKKRLKGAIHIINE